MRTTGAPNSVTLGAEGAEGAGSAASTVATAAVLLVETCAALALQAARRGDLEAARYLLQQALGAITTRVRA